jgi:large conductance mechanosensitive channel
LYIIAPSPRHRAGATGIVFAKHSGSSQEQANMLKSLWSEFKAFAFKGNMIDRAVAVVIGAAFSNVITAMVKDIINPAIYYAVTAVEEARETAKTAVDTVAAKVGATTEPATSQPATSQPMITKTETKPPAPAAAETPAAKPADANKVVDIDWKIGRFLIGDFIGAIINFIIQAFAVFILIVKLTESVMKKVGGTPAPSEPTTRECPECLSVIPLKAKRCPHCTSVVTPM